MNYKLEHFVDKLNRKESFALNRFNDGEMGVILGTHSVVSRGDQKSSILLKLKLLEAITYRCDDYYIGLPDKKFEEAFNNAEMIIGDYDNLTSSVVLHDDNWTDALRGIVNNADKFNNIIWVGSEKHEVDKLPFKVNRHIKTKHQNSFDDYYSIRKERIDPGSLVLVSCGPLGRVLVKEWFDRDDSLTIIEAGSIFDPITQGVWRSYQKRQRGEMSRLFNHWEQNR
jgi:hypothetical protein